MTEKDEILFAITKENMWKIATVVLGILLVLSFTTDIFKFGDDARTDSDALTDGTGEDRRALAGGDRRVVAGDGVVVITEYSDFECPFCKRFYDDAYKTIKETYGDQVVFEYRHFPLSFHPFAQKAAEASECARDQGKFWEYHDMLFDNQNNLGLPMLKGHAEMLKLDTKKFNDCLDTGAKEQLVKDDFAAGQAAGITGTPGFIINGQKITGAQPFSAFKPVIDAALAGDAPAPAAPAAPRAPAAKVDVSADDDAFLGDADAPVTIIEFSDYECPFCGRFYSQTLPQLKTEYIDTGKVKLVYRDFPLSFHPKAQKAAEAAECAGDQDRYFDFHDKIFENQGSIGVSDLKKYAGDLGLDQGEFDDCLDSGKFEQEVKDDVAAGVAAGLSGTPSFLINGQKLVGAQPFAAFKAIIDAELAE